jgi:tetratricopeptide (TPR) repeat protein
MRTILTPFLVLLALAGNLVMARADQKDSRLPALFASLEGAADVAQAHSIEQQIWLIWIRHGNPKIDALMQVGSQLMVPGEYQRSLAAFNQIIAEAPDFAEGWNKRATVLYLLGDFEGSVRDIERTLALEIRHFGALAGLGLIYRAIEKPESALEIFEKILKISPQSLGARLHIKQLRKALSGEKL